MSARLIVAEVLERAADLIEPEGAWIKGKAIADKYGQSVGWEDPKASCYCLFGAIKVAGGRPMDDDPVTVAALRSMDERHDSLIQFNDADDRTQAEVVAALRAAAVIAKGGE